MKVYAIYKGDNFIDVGTRKELSEKLGLSYDHLKRINMDTWKADIERYSTRLASYELDGLREYKNGL